jgi:hypothetical protein
MERNNEATRRRKRKVKEEEMDEEKENLQNQTDSAACRPVAKQRLCK